MLFEMLRFAFRAVSMIGNFIITILKSTCRLKSSMKSGSLLALLLLLKWLSFDWVFVTSGYYFVGIELIRVISSLMIRMTTVKIEIIIYSMLMFLCQKLSVLMV